MNSEHWWLDVIPRDNHPQTTRLLARLASRFGVEVTDGDTSYWSSSLVVAKVFDELVDLDGERDIEPFVQKVIDGIPIARLSSQQVEQFAIMYSQLSVERQERFVRAGQLGAYAVRRYAATDVDDYVDQTLAESSLFADIIKINEDQPDRVARTRFNDWLPAFGRAGYALDTIADMSSDYHEKLTQIKPSCSVYRKLAGVAYREVGRCIRDAPRGTVPLLGVSLIEKGIRTVVQAVYRD